jgi:hypothetical protein
MRTSGREAGRWEGGMVVMVCSLFRDMIEVAGLSVCLRSAAMCADMGSNIGVEGVDCRKMVIDVIKGRYPLSSTG